MARKRKTLPKDFEETLRSGDCDAMKAVFYVCEIDARGGYAKGTALSYAECPDDLSVWLVERGADLEFVDQSGRTPLHSRAGHWQGRVGVLLGMGAQANRPDGVSTPLHAAAKVHNLDAIGHLIANGASVQALNEQGLTPLGAALQACHNAKIDSMAEVAQLLLDAGSVLSRPGIFARMLRRDPLGEAHNPALKAMVRKLGETFEFYRADYNPDAVDAASAGLNRLYALFDVEPVAPRIVHPMNEPIAPGKGSWRERHDRLWQMLVPGKGAAATVQGEVVRASGRIADEIDGNGGINWDTQYDRMADALLRYLASGTPLTDAELDRARATVADAKRKRGQTFTLSELAVIWVEQNPMPVALPAPDYDR